MASDVDFISMSRNGQLLGFCHALPKTESRDFKIRRSKQIIFYLKAMRTHLCDPSRGKRYENYRMPGQKSYENRRSNLMVVQRKELV